MATPGADATTEARRATLQAIGSGQLPALQHVDHANDRSSPIIEDGVKLKTWDKEGFLHEVEAGKPLKHVTETHDRSAPVIEADVHIRPSPHKDIMTEVKAAALHRQSVQEIKSLSGSINLRHVEVVDKSKPAIPEDIHIKKWDKEGFLHEIQSPPKLKHVDPQAVHDVSSPVISEGIKIKKQNSHKEVMQQIQSIGSGEVTSPLKHVDPTTIHDASAPQLPKRLGTIVQQPADA